MARKLFLMLVLFSLVCVLGVFADDSSNESIDYNLTLCDQLCLNSSVYWDRIFVCDVNGTFFACCNNETLCEAVWKVNCSPITYFLPFFDVPDGDSGDGGDDGDGGDGDDGGSGLSPSALAALRTVPGSPRAMRLLISGDYAGDPIRISANNIFGPMSGVELKFFRDGELIRMIDADGVAEVVLDEPGSYVIEAYRIGYIPQTARVFIYSKPSEPAVPDVEPVIDLPVVDAEPPAVDYDRISGLVTMTSPKQKLNLGRMLIISLAVLAVLGVVGRQLIKRPPKKEEINWNI